MKAEPWTAQCRYHICGEGSSRLTRAIANLSLSFARMGLKTGILDTDIFGPSIPTIFNLSGEPRLSEGKLHPYIPILRRLTRGKKATSSSL